MFRFLVRRTIGALVILLIISAITFWLFYAVPRDPAMMSCGKNCTPYRWHRSGTTWASTIRSRSSTGTG